MLKENEEALKEKPINKNKLTKAAKQMKALFFLLEHRTPPFVQVDGIGLRNTGPALATTDSLLLLGV